MTMRVAAAAVTAPMVGLAVVAMMAGAVILRRAGAESVELLVYSIWYLALFGAPVAYLLEFLIGVAVHLTARHTVIPRFAPMAALSAIAGAGALMAFPVVPFPLAAGAIGGTAAAAWFWLVSYGGERAGAT
jgi:hypothetical protein